jgi:hypothetical protein
MKALAGEQTRSSDEPRVATRRGLPLIIPGELRLLMEKRDPQIIKFVLTMLTVYRTMTSTPKLRLGTITDPFSGNLKTTGEIKPIMQYVIKNFFSAKAEKIFRGHEDKSPFIVGRNLLVLTTAGPNVSNQLTGYPLDSKIYENNPVLLKAYLILSKYLKCQDLYSKLKADMAVFQKKGITIPSSLSGPVKSGKLSLKFEAAGKVRVFAIIDA